MGSEKAFLLSVIYKGRKFPQGSEAVEVPKGRKNAPAGGPEAVEAPGEMGKNAPAGGQQAVEAPTLRRRPSLLLSPAARSAGDKKIQEGRR